MVKSSLRAAGDVTKRVKEAVDDVNDPCALARGFTIGLGDMGLIRSLDVTPSGEGWNVDLKLRLTSPTCFYFFYFKREILSRLDEVEEISSASVEWDPVYDWTPKDLSESAKGQLQSAREKLLLSVASATPVASTAGQT